MAYKVFHESRVTNHGLFIACFDRRVVRNAGQLSFCALRACFASRRSSGTRRDGLEADGIGLWTRV